MAPVRSRFTRSGSPSEESPRPNSSESSAFSAKARTRTIIRSSVSEGWRARVSEWFPKWLRSRSETCSSALKIVDLRAMGAIVAHGGARLVVGAVAGVGGELTPGARPVEELGHAHRAPDVVALRGGAAHLEEQAPLDVRLDAFGHHVDLQLAAELQARLHHRTGMQVPGRLLHEGAVDLELGERHPREALHRGVAGAVVVEREAEALDPQAREVLELGGEVARGRRFGHLEHHRRGIDAL